MTESSKITHLNDGDPWIIAEDIPDIDFQFSQIWLSSFVNDIQKALGVGYKKVLCVYDGYNLKFYYGKKDSDDLAKHILGAIVSDPRFGEKINYKIRKLSKKFKKFSNKITPRYLGGLSNKELASFYKSLDDLHTELYMWGWMPNAVDMFHANFTEYLRGIIATKLPDDDVSVSFMALSTSPEKSVIQEEHESFLKLVALKQTDASAKKLDKALQKHLKKYFYFKHLWIGKEGVYDRIHYENEIEKFLASGEKAFELLKKEEDSFKEILRERKGLIKKLSLSRDQVRIFNVYADFAVTKLIRRDAQLFWAYKMDFVFEELAKRLGMGLMETRFMLPQEVCGALESELSLNLKQTITERTKHCVYYTEKNLDIVAIGQEAAVFEKTIQHEEVGEVKEFKGQVACVGKVIGIVKIVNSVSDMKKINDGDVLVSIATNPDILPAMKKAVAFVTEQGGITSHAAIVAREMKKPCVIGTKIATKVLKDGDRIEVDANKGIIKKLN